LIAVTFGDAAGIGPEIVLKAIGGPHGLQKVCRPVVVGDLWVLERAARDLQIPARIRQIGAAADAEGRPGMVEAIDRPMVPEGRLEPGRPNVATGGAMIAHTKAAVGLALEGVVQGAVGGPHSKKAAEDAGYHFEGYPGLIAEMTASPHPYLMLVAGGLRVSNVTLHVSMRRALEILDENLVFHCIEETAKALLSFGVRKPRIAVAGLNPHAGEDRLFGDEDEDVIRPAIERATALDIDAVGPKPADSLFVGIEDPPYDAYVGMYHDQAHLPVKIVAFKRASAVAIGVPVNWATVDHGCALDIAWRNRADERVLVETIKLVASRAGEEWLSVKERGQTPGGKA
jgi:4-hydroxythreonine-4-phosphate dehydrogenase